MKQLTKEQHEARMEQHCDMVYGQYLVEKFTKDFSPSCCDYFTARLEHYPKAIFAEPTPEWQKKQISIDRIPEETSAHYMDRVATINGRK